MLGHAGEPKEGGSGMVTWLVGALEGSGIIFADGLRLGPAEYSINVERDAAGRVTAHGRITAKDSLLQEAYEAGDVVLRLDSNKSKRLKIKVGDPGPASSEIDIEDPSSLALVEMLAAKNG